MTILEAISDASVFGSAFAVGDWSRWRSFLAAVYGLELQGEALATYRACTGRDSPPVAAAREVYACVGRRGGKTRIAAAIAAHAASQDYRPRLAPGEWATVACIAADRSQAGIIFGYIKALLLESKLLCRLVARETADTLELKNRVRIEVTTASARTTRGYSFALVVCDELAFWKSDESAEPDTEVLNAVRPGLATLGGIVVGISSPYARRGALWLAFKRHYGQDSATLVWQAPSLVMNPTLPAAVVEDALAEDESAARAEYLAEFRSDLEAFVSREVLEQVTVPGRLGLPPLPGVTYTAFADPSGGSADSFTLAIAHHERRGDTVVAVLDLLAERRPPFSPEAVVEEFAGILKSYKLSAVTGDRYSGAWCPERFAHHGIHYEASERTKSEIYGAALPLLNSGRVELLQHRRLEAQLLGLERRTSRAGKDSIDHGPGGHDDAANSACGALVQAAALVALDVAPVVRERGGGTALPARARLDWSSVDAGGVPRRGGWREPW